MERKPPPSERDLLNLVRDVLRTRLPASWCLEEKASRRRFDAILRLRAPDGRCTSLFCEAKTVFNTRDVAAFLQRIGRSDDSPVLLVARYLSPRTRNALTAAKLSYVDATGNVAIRIDNPALFIQGTGLDNDPWRGPDRPTNSLRGRPAARVVRTLVDLRSPQWKVRDLAVVAGASLGSTARTLDFLSREAIIERSPVGIVTSVLWDALLERWAVDYDLPGKQRAVQLIEPRSLVRLEAAASRAGIRYAISGSLAARWCAAYAEPKLAVLYAEDLDRMREAVALRETDEGANVLLIEATDDLVFIRTWEKAGVIYAALAQVVVDLMAGPGRNPEEGTALLRWMRENEETWRSWR